MQSEVIPQNESMALVKPTTERAIVMADSLKEDTEQRALIKQYVALHMQEGVDYGTIPGTKNKTLLKPGAEKLTDLFRCTAQFEIANKIEDWDRGLFHYEFHAKICSREHGTVLAEGYGSANSKEGRYRWRTSHRKCPQCGKETIKRSKFPPRDKPSEAPEWYCFGKVGGCGASFSATDPRITEQVEGKVENDDVFTLVNTILKMAKKRALVDGAIALARCSDIFTQDLEDFVDAETEDSGQTAQQQSQTQQQERKSHAENKAAAKDRLVNGPGPSPELQAVLAGIANAQDVEELATIQSEGLPAKMTTEEKSKARAAFNKRRDELSEARSHGDDHHNAW